MKSHLNIILSALLMAVAAVVAVSCSEDRLPAPPDYTVSGEPVRLKVPVLIPQMNAETRGDLSENQLNKVDSLWIRTYNAQTKLATCDWIKLNPLTSDLHNMRSVEIDTQSGYSYIVAVANVSMMGVKSDDITNPKPLSDLLDAADTWDDFMKIAVLSPSNQDNVNAPQVNTLPMAGCYSDAITDGEYAEHIAYNQWQKADFQPYFIPASADKVEFKGGIHLRRLISHITFNFSSGDPHMSLEVNSYSVMNVPKFSWLYERSDEITTEANFGDKAASAEDALNVYVDVPQFGSQFIKDKTIDGKAVQSFDFWQAENKHTGKETCTSYTDRDKKSVKDGVTLFTSLTGDTWTPDNEASYVVVDCTMEYDESIIVDDDGKRVEEGTEGSEKVRRSGNATYFIHLGNIIGDSPQEKARDFNCFRNVDYTYNVTVNGIDDIRVDAVADSERFHGEEGLVVDLLDKTIDLDAHYGVFNIMLTEAELQENFGFIITTYDNGEQITLSEKNPRENVNNKVVIYADEGKKNPIDPKYYNWIELRPTDGENVLAEYKPRFGPNADGKTFLLTDMYNAKDVAGNNILNMPDKGKSTTGYYTVFVNEYTYEPMYGDDDYGIETGLAADGRPRWMHYVNQNPRRFYIKVSYRESNDHNSVYARSKYAVEQQSLMTYYSQINLEPGGTAIGVERENETLGLNLRHADNSGGSSTINGRWNAAQYLSTGGVDDYFGKKEDYNSGNPWASVSVNRPNDDQKSAWSTFLEMNEPLEVPGVSGLRAQGGPEIKERTIRNKNPHKLRKIKCHPTPDPNPTPTPNEAYISFTDPQSENRYNIRAMSAFVNRNRDNNGNNKIDAEELRWYIPAITRYTGMTLGENAMPQKLMMFNEITQLPFVLDNNSGFSDDSGRIENPYYSRYMYLASNAANDGNNNILWAMEGTSMSKYSQLTEWANNNKMNPWQIRCVRNLGSNLRTVVINDEVTLPYIHQNDRKMLTMNYFNLAAIRTYKLTGNGLDNSDFMPIHTINSPYNSVYAAFEYANKDIIVPEADRPASQAQYFDKLRAYITKNPCGNAGFSGTGWRVPNQIELTMMFNSGVLDGDGNWLSCTVDYFDRADGKGSDAIAHKLYMGATSGKTLLLSWDNYWGRTLRVRCVRDVNP